MIFPDDDRQQCPDCGAVVKEQVHPNDQIRQLVDYETETTHVCSPCDDENDERFCPICGARIRKDTNGRWVDYRSGNTHACKIEGR